MRTRAKTIWRERMLGCAATEAEREVIKKVAIDEDLTVSALLRKALSIYLKENHKLDFEPK